MCDHVHELDHKTHFPPVIQTKVQLLLPTSKSLLIFDVTVQATDLGFETGRQCVNTCTSSEKHILPVQYCIQNRHLFLAEFLRNWQREDRLLVRVESFNLENQEPETGFDLQTKLNDS